MTPVGSPLPETETSSPFYGLLQQIPLQCFEQERFLQSELLGVQVYPEKGILVLRLHMTAPVPAETYASVSQVLPPLSTLAETASRYQDFALAGEFNQAWNDMLTMQQALKPYLSFLLRNHDQTFLIMESNLAGCQNQFTSRRESEERAVPMKNIPPVFKGRRRVPKKTEQEVPNATTNPQEKKP